MELWPLLFPLLFSARGPQPQAVFIRWWYFMVPLPSLLSSMVPVLKRPYPFNSCSDGQTCLCHCNEGRPGSAARGARGRFGEICLSHLVLINSAYGSLWLGLVVPFLVNKRKRGQPAVRVCLEMALCALPLVPSYSLSTSNSHLSFLLPGTP